MDTAPSKTHMIRDSSRTQYTRVIILHQHSYAPTRILRSLDCASLLWRPLFNNASNDRGTKRHQDKGNALCYTAHRSQTS